MDPQVCPSCRTYVMATIGGRCPACGNQMLPAEAEPASTALPTYPCPPYGLGLSDPSELYLRVPGYRKSEMNSAVLIGSLATWLLAGFMPPPLSVVLGFGATLAVVAVCVIVLTGPVYLPNEDPKRRYHLDEWSAANKVAAVLFLTLQLAGLLYLLGSAP